MGKLARNSAPVSPIPIEEHARELLAILSAYNPSKGLEEFQNHLLDYILKLTGASGVMVFTTQAAEPPIVERFLFTPNGELNHLEPVLIKENNLQSYLKSQNGQYIDLKKDEGFRSDMQTLAPNLTATAVYFSPMVVNQENLGFLLTLNPEKSPSSPIPSLLAMIATNLANAVLNHRLMQQFQITIADLEASRWEVLTSRNTLRTLFDNIPISIYIVNKDYSIAAINRHRASQLDIPITRIVGRKCYKVLFNQDGICPGCEINQSLLEGKNTSRLRQFWREGQDIPTIMDIASYPVLNEDKNIIQAIMVEDDITEKTSSGR